MASKNVASDSFGISCLSDAYWGCFFLNHYDVWVIWAYCGFHFICLLDGISKFMYSTKCFEQHYSVFFVIIQLQFLYWNGSEAGKSFQHMFFFVPFVFDFFQETRGRDTNADIRGVIGQVEEQTHVVHGTVLLKVRLKEPGCLHVDLVEGEKTPVTYIYKAACIIFSDID